MQNLNCKFKNNGHFSLKFSGSFQYAKLIHNTYSSQPFIKKPSVLKSAGRRAIHFTLTLQPKIGIREVIPESAPDHSQTR